MDQLPKRIRLLKSCYNHLYNEVKLTLATDREIKNLRHLDNKIQNYYVGQVGATELCSTCNNGDNCICRENEKYREASNG